MLDKKLMQLHFHTKQLNGYTTRVYYQVALHVL